MQTMTVAEAAKTLRTMTPSEREWVLVLVNKHGEPWERAVPYVLDFRNCRIPGQ